VPPLSPNAQTIVMGAGISGLACGYYLQKSGVRVLVLEQSGRPGGLIRSVRRDGLLLEEGPQSFLLTVPMLDVIRDLGIESELLRADPRAARYVLLRNKLRRVPLAPPQLFSSSLLGVRTKLSFLRDAFGRSCPPEADESVADFVRRKFTGELLDRLVGPFVAGIYAGDPEQLSLRGAFPAIHELEAKHGSVIRGAMKSRGERGGSRLGSASFRNGNETLPSALCKSLGEAIQCNTAVESLRVEELAGVREYVLTIIRDGARQTLRARAVIVTTPTSVTAGMLRSLSPSLSEALGSIKYAPVAMLYTAFERSQVAHPLAGFGFLVPSSEGKQLLGTVWNSSLFAGRAPEGTVLFTSFTGGTTNPDLASASPEMVRDTLLRELAPVLGIRGAPALWSVKQYPRAIPQYTQGHTQLVQDMNKSCKHLHGLFLAGNYLEGPSIGACIDVARRAAAAAQDYLQARGA
jgi:protoporphyrinogen/coproporphyrinogen III oxidase